MIKKILYPAAAVILLIVGRNLLETDFTPFLQWWGIILCLGFVSIPLTSVLFSSFKDKGYLFSKTIGIAVTGYLMWVFSSLRILKFTEASCLISLFITALINVIILIIKKQKSAKNHANVNTNQSGFASFKDGSLDLIFGEEILFFALFLIFTYIRCFKPQAYGTEKFMDYGFMTTMMRSDYMPPQDFWYSGTSLNYYYVGQYLAAFLTKLSFVKTSAGYNLMLMMTGAFAVVLPFSLAYHLTLRYGSTRTDKKMKRLPMISGLIAGAGVCLAGNMHYPIFKWVIPPLQKAFGSEVYFYWFPASTRYIGSNPDTHDKTIHEFPSYSFVLGDLHAHVINILFVLTVLGILLGWHYKRMEQRKEKISLLREIMQPGIVMISFFIGLFHMTNYWDFPIYYVVSGAVILFTNLIVYNFKGKALWLTALQGIFVLALAELICLPFTLKFDKISTQLYLVDAVTPLYQLLILWGLPIFTVLLFLGFLIKESKITRERNASTSQLPKKSSPVSLFMKNLTSSDLFVITIGLCAIGLVLLPEIFYVKDIYSGDYKRANTMFKLTYQAFIMFGICFGYIFTRVLKFGSKRSEKWISSIGLILFAMTICYVGNATKSWYGNIFDRKGFEGIDATAFMERDFPDDAAAAKWLNQNIDGTPVVLEANGNSYTEYQRISVITGLPTVLGWHTHERLWKSQPGKAENIVLENLNQRAVDIQTIYTSQEEDVVKSLIKKYKISYIYVGGLEQKKYQNINHVLLKSLGEIVYEVPATEAIASETYIIKVD